MNDEYNINNIPPEGTPEHDLYMRNHFGDEYEYGYRVGFGRRLGAYIIDIILTAIIGSMVIYFNGAFQELLNIEDLLNNMSRLSLILEDSILISSLLILLYYSTEIFLGASPGKMILGLVIADSNRTDAEIGKLVNRYLLKHSNSILAIIALITSISMFELFSNLILLIILIGFFFTLTNKRQALHDSLTGTAVYFKENIKFYKD